jgi:hypothetical protein
VLVKEGKRSGEYSKCSSSMTPDRTICTSMSGTTCMGYVQTRSGNLETL